MRPEAPDGVGRGPSAPRSVAVTGLGAVSAAGWGVASLWPALREGRTRLGSFSRFDHTRHRTHIAGQVPDGPLSPPLPRELSRLTLSERFALFAAREAVAEAGLEAPLTEGPAGVFFGTSTGGLLESEWYLGRLWQPGGPRASLQLMAGHQLNAPGDAVARHLRVTGPVETISSACASAALAIAAALFALREGEVELAIAGGSDCLCATTYAGFNSLRSVDESPCRPFGQDRSGLSLGEGAGVLVLEPLERAQARGARVRALILGAGASCDANHMTAPLESGQGAATAIARALEDAATTPERVGYINAHGTGTPLNDAAEWAAYSATFGEGASRIPVSATKGILGHLLGSSGAIEAVATVLCLEAGEGHPSAGAGSVDPNFGVDLVRGEPRGLPGDRVALSTSLGFGGANAVLVFSREPHEAG
jgi:3-oxoacyl-(acyl-carrier-protein) synthase